MNNEEKRLWSIVVALLFVYRHGDCDVVIKPTDTEVQVGDPTYLNCTVSDGTTSVSWYHYPVGKGTSSPNYVYTSEKMFRPYDQRFRVEKNTHKGASNLVITNAEVQDAGRYVCKTPTTSAVAELIVLESLPVCMSNNNPNGFIGPNACRLKQDTLELSCGVSYSGNIPPDLQLIATKYNTTYSITSSCNASSDRMMCNYTSTVNTDMDGAFFICQANRSGYLPYNCKTQPLNIASALGNETKIAKYIGDVVTCSANTRSVECTYRWVWSASTDCAQETVSVNDTLTVTKQGLYRCEANCRFTKHVCIITSMVVEVPKIATDSDEDTDTSRCEHFYWIIGIVSLVCCCLAISTLILCLKNTDRHKKRKQRPSLFEGITVDDRKNGLPEATTTAAEPKIEDGKIKAKSLEIESLDIEIKAKTEEVQLLKEQVNDLLRRIAKKKLLDGRSMGNSRTLRTSESNEADGGHEGTESSSTLYPDRTRRRRTDSHRSNISEETVKLMESDDSE